MGDGGTVPFTSAMLCPSIIGAGHFEAESRRVQKS